MDFSKIESGKLTKKFFMGLPEKVFLVSNCYEDAIRPIFSEHVAAPGVPRQMQWEKIKSAYADQRHCDIFDSENDFKDYYKKKHLPMVLKSYNPKIDVGKVELFIKDIASMKCEFSYSPNVSSEWKILFGNKSTDYKIFIHYEDPLSVKIVLVSSMNYIDYLRMIVFWNSNIAVHPISWISFCIICK